MNAVEIESAISELALEPFNAEEFPFDFLAAFGNKDTTIKRLRTGNNNASDMAGGVLLRNNIHIAVCESGKVTVGLAMLCAKALPPPKPKPSSSWPRMGRRWKPKIWPAAKPSPALMPDFPNHFGFFLPLAGISTIKEIKDNPIDVRATGRLNKLYVELLRDNPEWATDERAA